MTLGRITTRSTTRGVGRVIRLLESSLGCSIAVGSIRSRVTVCVGSYTSIGLLRVQHTSSTHTNTSHAHSIIFFAKSENGCPTPNFVVYLFVELSFEFAIGAVSDDLENDGEEEDKGDEADGSEDTSNSGFVLEESSGRGCSG